MLLVLCALQEQHKLGLEMAQQILNELQQHLDSLSGRAAPVARGAAVSQGAAVRQEGLPRETSALSAEASGECP